MSIRGEVDSALSRTRLYWSITVTEATYERLRRVAQWEGTTMTSLFTQGLQRYLDGRLHTTIQVRRGRRPLAGSLGKSVPMAGSRRRVMAFYARDLALLARVRRKLREDGLALAALVAAIARDTDPLNGSRREHYIAGLAQEIDVHIDGNAAASAVIAYHLRHWPRSPRGFLWGVRAALSSIPEGALEGRLLVACALEWLGTAAGPHLRPVRDELKAYSPVGLVSAATTVARGLCRVQVQMPPLAVYLLVLAAAAGYAPDTLPPTVAQDVARTAIPLAQAVEAQLVHRFAPRRDVWAEGMFEAFYRIAADLISRRHPIAESV